ncbi:MAG TPA: hypothetical protein VNA89_13295, partial [Gemmatimonadaceae bacterium]|nr:hypothetical protein [Gemmatimonadaceae bacterium]
MTPCQSSRRRVAPVGIYSARRRRLLAVAILPFVATILPAACSAQGAQGGAASVRQAETLRRASRYEQ